MTDAAAATVDPYPPVDEAKALVASLCAQFYTLGWVSGTGGGLSMRAAGGAVVMAPSGVQKERMTPDDMFVLNADDGSVRTPPTPRPPPAPAPKLSECAPLFMAAYEMRGAGAVAHSHSMWAVLATLLDEGASEFRCTHLEMIKGVAGHGYYGPLVVPIIENTARECELTGRLRDAIAAYPKSNAVLVRRHGVYVWGASWGAAKAQAESYDYLFEAAVRMRGLLGIDAAAVPAPPPPPRVTTGNGAAAAAVAAPPAPKRARAANGAASSAPPPPTAIVLDIEGTVAPISFVSTVLFPYARARLASYLTAGYDTPLVQRQLDALRAAAAADAAAGVAVPPIPPPDAGAAAVVAGAVANMEAAMDGDRKLGPLKDVQGCIWTDGFAGGALAAPLFTDVADALAALRAAGIKTYVYSSGSRRAQRDLFAHSTAGDLRPYLCGFFDTATGAKGDPASYDAIAASIGADAPADILFVTDVLAEARAARDAGWRVAVAVREGNAPLEAGHGFRTVTTLDGLV